MSRNWKSLTGALLAAAALAACEAPPPEPVSEPESAPETTLALNDDETSARRLARKMEAEPQAALEQLWDEVGLPAHTDVVIYCMHQEAGDELPGCREFVVEHADSLLDLTAFGGADAMLVYLLGDDPDATREDLARALRPVMAEQFKGGFAERLGRVLVKRKLREDQQRQHQRLQATRQAVQNWMQNREPAELPSTAEIAALSQEDPAALIDLMLRVVPVHVIQNLVEATGSASVPEVQKQLAARGDQLLVVEGGAERMLAAGPPQPLPFMNWLARQMIGALRIEGGRIEDQLDAD